jgi:hypothetical protein
LGSLAITRREAEQGSSDACRGVLSEHRRDVRVALCDPQIGVPEDLLNHPDVDALFEQKRAGRVPSVMHAGIADTSQVEERLPLLPVVARNDANERRNPPAAA